MDEKKVELTDEEIVKALECCQRNEAEDTCAHCLDCPASDWDYEDNLECHSYMMKQSINLIHRQKAEIERLKNETTYLQRVADAFKGDYKNAKADGVRELLQELIEMEIKLDPLRSGIRYKALIGYAEEKGVEVE